MMDDIFQGKRELFNGLFIERSDYDWKKYPVIHIDFASCSKKTAAELASWINKRLLSIAKELKVSLPRDQAYDDNFLTLIETLGKKNQVVILVDEYDRVLLDNLLNPELSDMMNVLNGFFCIIKGMGNYVRFCFITGVTKFPVMSAFSGMNNLKDLSYSKNYACMYGYTQEELETYFAEEIEKGIKATGMDRATYLQKVKDWYGGYWFAPGAEQVYNPFSINTFFNRGKGNDFLCSWIDGGSMRLFYDIREKFNFDIIESLANPITFDDLMSFNVLDMASEKISRTKLKTLLFQTGFLTIKSVDEVKNLYLGIPNKEVEEAFRMVLPNAFQKENIEHHRFSGCIQISIDSFF